VCIMRGCYASMKQYFIAQVARVPRCFDNYNINECVGYGVWHFSCTYHKMQFLVSAITLDSIFNLFVVGGTSQAMACVYLRPPTQYPVKGLNHVDQDARKLKGWNLGHQQYICCHVSGIYYSHYMGSVLRPLPGREEQHLESKDYPNKMIIHHTHWMVVVSLFRTQY
jgi:hypothetical protein